MDPSETRLEKWRKPEKGFATEPSLGNEVSLRLQVRAGVRYVVVPATKAARVQYPFWLRFYFSTDLYRVDVRRIDVFERCK